LQGRHEILSGTVEKLEAEAASVERSIETMRANTDHLHETYAKLETANKTVDERLRFSGMETKALNSEIASTDKAFMKANAENAEAEEKMVSVLGDQTTVEKGSAGSAADIKKRRALVRTRHRC
jgi:septal ring factor EnvC (AmiA/AmiB activator)